MAPKGSQVRPGRSRSVVTITFVAWALWVVALSSLHVKAWLESRNAIVCADRRSVFSPDQGADELTYLLFDDGRLAVVDIGAYFPFALKSALGGVPQSNTLRFVDRSSGRTLSALITTIDGRLQRSVQLFKWRLFFLRCHGPSCVYRESDSALVSR